MKKAPERFLRSFFIKTSVYRREHAEAVVNYMPWADHRAHSAAETEGGVDHGMKMLKTDRVRRTLFHAQPAGDAAHVADRARAGFRCGVKALVQIGAKRLDAVVQQPQTDELARAFARRPRSRCMFRP